MFIKHRTHKIKERRQFLQMLIFISYILVYEFLHRIDEHEHVPKTTCQLSNVSHHMALPAPTYLPHSTPSLTPLLKYLTGRGEAVESYSRPPPAIMDITSFNMSSGCDWKPHSIQKKNCPSKLKTVMMHIHRKTTAACIFIIYSIKPRERRFGFM